MMNAARKWRVTGLIVALSLALGMALAGCGAVTSGQNATGYPTVPAPMATATLAPTATPTGAAWTQVSDLSQAPSGAPFMQRTQYDTYAGQTSKTSAPEFVLRRSDDFGKTWVNLSPPQIVGVSYPASVNYITVAQSPLNSLVALLTMQLNGGNCPQTAGFQASSICQVQYLTTDGGASWQSFTPPAAGLLGFTLPLGAMRDGAFRVQGTRLYSAVSQIHLASSGTIPPGRIVVSDDSGATWRLADAALAARNLFVYDYAVAPSGSTLFALAGADDANLMPGALPSLSLWRSDDAGATWKATGALPQPVLSGMLATVDTASQRVTLYAAASDGGKATTLVASRDGGATWATGAVAADDAQSATPGLLGALPDGVALLDGAAGIEAWDGSAGAPMLLTQPTGLQDVNAAYATRLSDGSTRLWIAGDDAQGTVYEYATLRL